MPQTLRTKVSSFSDRIKFLRREKSLSAADLAKLANVTPAAVWHWEHTRVVPRRKTISSIAEKLGVSADFLAGRTLQVSNFDRTSQPASHPLVQRVSDISLEHLIRAIEAKGFSVTLHTLRQPS